ncbi:hypothetical protein JCM3770_001921 [Rhodotorula araucariae]
MSAAQHASRASHRPPPIQSVAPPRRVLPLLLPFDPARAHVRPTLDIRLRSPSIGSLEPLGSASTAATAVQGRSVFPFVDGAHGQADRDNLDGWAPPAPPPERLPPSQVPHLPNIRPCEGGDASGKGTTSRPFQAPLTTHQASVAYSLSRLLSYPRFAAFCATPLGYAQFSAYLASLAPENEALADLELWKDTIVLSQLAKQCGHGAKGIHKVYLAPEARPQIDLPDEVKHDLFAALRMLRMGGAPGLDLTSKHLLGKLFAAEFDNFVKTRLLAHTKTQLSKYSLKVEDRGGIGSAFLLTNPRLRDDPIVLVSPGFCELTGYTAQQIIGRNCRFLQGKATAPDAVGNIRTRLEGGEEVVQIVLNYRADGTPFLNLLHVLPLRDLDGHLAYFLGGQTDMTRALTTGTDLSLILPEDERLSVDLSAFTPAVQLEARDAASKPAPAVGMYAAVDIPEFPVPPRGPGHENDYGGRGSGGEDRTAAAADDDDKVGGLHALAALFGCGSGGDARVSKRKEKKSKATKKAAEAGERVGQLRGEDDGRERQQGTEPLVAPTLKDTTTTMPLEKRLLDVQVTYERLAVVKRQTREIVFTTPGFLRSLGLPGTTRSEVDRSPLVYADLLDLVVAPQAPSPTSPSTKEVRARVAQAFRDAVGLQVVCGMQFRAGTTEGSGARDAPPTPVAVGRLHLAPLLDMLGESIAFTAIFG